MRPFYGVSCGKLHAGARTGVKPRGRSGEGEGWLAHAAVLHPENCAKPNAAPPPNLGAGSASYPRGSDGRAARLPATGSRSAAVKRQKSPASSFRSLRAATNRAEILRATAGSPAHRHVRTRCAALRLASVEFGRQPSPRTDWLGSAKSSPTGLTAASTQKRRRFPAAGVRCTMPPSGRWPAAVRPGDTTGHRRKRSRIARDHRFRHRRDRSARSAPRESATSGSRRFRAGPRAVTRQPRSRKKLVWSPMPAPTSRTFLPARSSPRVARCSRRRLWSGNDRSQTGRWVRWSNTRGSGHRRQLAT